MAQYAVSKFKVLFFLVLLFIFFIPLSQQISSKVLVVACLFSFFVGNFREGLTLFFKNSWDILFYLLVLIIGLLFSQDLNSGLRVLETNLCLLAVPLAFSRIQIAEEKQLNMLFYAFAVGLSLACLICLTNAVLTYTITHSVESFFFYNLTGILNFQPTYFAYYLIFTIAYALYQFYYHDSTVNPYVNATIILFLFLVLMLTGGQTAFVSMLLIFSFFILKFLTEEKSTTKKVSAGLVTVMIAIMFFATLIDKGQRELELNDSWDRLVLWEAAIEATPNLFTGVGTGDYKIVLNDYYNAHHLERFAKESYNSHNQFIQLLFSNGLFGVLALVILIARPLYLSIRNQNTVGILFFFPFLIYGMTEVFFGRYQGVVFFAFLHQFLMIKLKKEKQALLKL